MATKGNEYLKLRLLSGERGKEGERERERERVKRETKKRRGRKGTGG